MNEVICPKCSGQMWDNRPKKRDGTFSMKSPDFKCKDKDNCDGVIWPEKKANANYPVSEAEIPHSAWSPEEAKAKADTRSSRIERQHSQEMAIRWLELTAADALKELSTQDQWDLLDKTTDMFVGDLD